MSALERPVTKQRPVYLNLVRIRLPLPGLVSFLHRVSGAGLFVIGVPLLLLAVQKSLASPEAFADVRAALATPLAKIVLLGLAWAFLHHFCAGIRFLLLDVHQGIELGPARRSSGAVLVISLALTLLFGVWLW
jgi:succinate dehydrogenase / fumarate reductase cytochrome b subunit